MLRTTLIALLFALPFTSHAQCFLDAPYLNADAVKLVKLLPPPAAPGSAELNSELAELLSVQETRTPEQAQRALADNERTVWRFKDVIPNARFKKKNLPKVDALFNRLLATENAIIDPAKDAWNRPRPFEYSHLIHPVVPLPKSRSYPSGHATIGTLMGIVLANMLPEYRAEIMARAKEYADNRMVGGVHFRSDVEQGRVAATVIAQALSWHGHYKDDYKEAKRELRAELGLQF